MVVTRAAERGRGITYACRASGPNRSQQTSLSQSCRKLLQIVMLLGQGSHVQQTLEKACLCLPPADSSCRACLYMLRENNLGQGQLSDLCTAQPAFWACTSRSGELDPTGSPAAANETLMSNAPWRPLTHMLLPWVGPYLISPGAHPCRLERVDVIHVCARRLALHRPLRKQAQEIGCGKASQQVISN